MKAKRGTTLKIYFAVLIVVMVTTTSIIPVSAYADERSGSPELEFLTLLMDYIKEHHIKDVTDMELLRGAIKGMMNSLEDPYSTYFSPQEFKDFNDATKGNFGGIGVVITSKDQLITVVSVLPGTPAERAGIKPNDRIVEIDGISVRNVSVSEVLKFIKGDEGTQVNIGVLRDGEKQMLNFTITRATIKINPIESKILGQGIGYLKISEFNENTAENFKAVLDAFKAGGVVGIVLDLRNNPGGFLDQAIEVASYFLPKGPVVNLVQKDGTTQTFYSKSNPDHHSFKLAVLVDGGSASASEIVAGAIKDWGAGILVGEKTFGKATVQKTLNLGALGGIKLTVAHYTTPKGTDINNIGIVPDIVVKALDKNPTLPFHPVKGDRNLSYGKVGLDVLGVQQRLALLNFFKATPDGVYGPLTQEAVKAFQSKRGLKATGIADRAFYESLEMAMEEFIDSREDPQLRRAIDVLKEELRNRAA